MKGQLKKLVVTVMVFSFVTVGCSAKTAPASPPTQPPLILVPPTATPSADPYVLKLQGTYEKTITKEDNPQNAGKWRMVITPSMGIGSMQIMWDGTLAVTEYFTVTQDTLMFTNTSQCSGRGTYKWALEGKTLTLTKIADDCVARASVAPTHPWIKLD